MLIRTLSAALLLAFATSTVGAQSLPAAPVPTPAETGLVPALLTRADTARAVHELFKSRRGGAAGWLSLGSMLASILSAQQSTSAGGQDAWRSGGNCFSGYWAE